MLASTGKLSSIGEILRFMNADPPPPQLKLSRSLLCSVHFGGIFHARPCSSQVAGFPPSRAAASAALGVGFTYASPEVELPPLGDALESVFEDFFNLSVRLQSDNPRTIARIRGICFILVSGLR